MENRQGEGKNSVGNVEAKELISMPHGPELGGGLGAGGGWAGWSGVGGKWDNCNSIINKYIKKKKEMEGKKTETKGKRPSEKENRYWGYAAKGQRVSSQQKLKQRRVLP